VINKPQYRDEKGSNMGCRAIVKETGFIGCEGMDFREQ
jgi:hypothetical protein